MLGVLVLVLITAAPPAIRAEDPTATPGERFIAVSSGEYHTCALRADGAPVCWGAVPVDPDAGLDPVDFGQASPPDDERFVAISSGGWHTCGLREDGTAVCWGAALDDQAERYGQVGFGQSSAPDDERFTAISSGGWHTCGLRADGTAVCWGNDGAGQASPPEDERFTLFSSGGYHTCALHEDGQAVCWGPEPHSGTYGGWEAPPDEPLVALSGTWGKGPAACARTAPPCAGELGRTWSMKAPSRPRIDSSP